MNTFLTEILNPLNRAEVGDFLYLDAPLIGNMHISITNIPPEGGRPTRGGWGPGFYFIVPPGGGGTHQGGWGPGLIFVIIIAYVGFAHPRGSGPKGHFYLIKINSYIYV